VKRSGPRRRKPSRPISTTGGPPCRHRSSPEQSGIKSFPDTN
jgi:hypothetical protein